MVLSEVSNSIAAPSAPKGKATVEQTYQKLTQHEHIMQRPDSYVGSIEMLTSEMWVFEEEAGRMAQKKLAYVPGLYKIFDEILVNAADNKQRDSSMTELKVEIDAEKNRISVYNNGRGIPVVMHKEHNIYVPELIFGTSMACDALMVASLHVWEGGQADNPGILAPAPLPLPPTPFHCAPLCHLGSCVARFVAGHLLTSSNYNDDQKKITGGRNGYGRHLRLTSARCLCLTLNPPLSNPHVNTRTHLAHAGAKLANIFSTEFVVETADSNEGKRYKQALLQLSHPIPQQVPLQATACLSQ